MAARRGSIRFSEQFFYPDGWAGAQIPRDVVVHLSRSGFEVSVVCGSEPYSPSKGDPGPDPQQEGVDIIRMPRLFGGNIHSRKLLRQLWFCLCAAPVLCLGRAPDLYLTQTNPPLLVPMVALAAWFRRKRFVIIAQDVYPEVMMAYGMIKTHGFAADLLARLFRWSYRRADRVISLGQTMTRRLVEKGVVPTSVVEISNWATGNESIVRGSGNQLRQSWGLEEKFVVLYSGNIGVAHEVRTAILGAALAARSLPDLRLVFIGQGRRLQEAEDLVVRHALQNIVLFRPPVPTCTLPHSLGLADVALVTLREGFEGLVVPSKLLGYMARGIPTIFVGPDSDAGTLLGDSGGGVCVKTGDVEGFAATVTSLAGDVPGLARMGTNAMAYYVRNLSRDIGLEKYLGVAEALMPAAARP